MQQTEAHVPKCVHACVPPIGQHGMKALSLPQCLGFSLLDSFELAKALMH